MLVAATLATSVPMTRTPLNVVVSLMRPISALSSWNSAFRLSRSASLLVPLADCTASSRMRWSMLPTSLRPPSAVCAREMPSLAFLIATFMPRTWVFMRSAMARPAASSLALLMRSPEESRSIEVAIELCERVRFRWAVRDMMLVLMVCAMTGIAPVSSRDSLFSMYATPRSSGHGRFATTVHVFLVMDDPVSGGARAGPVRSASPFRS